MYDDCNKNAKPMQPVSLWLASIPPPGTMDESDQFGYRVNASAFLETIISFSLTC